MTEPTPAAPGAAPLDHAAVRTIVIGILLAMFLAALDQTIVATALPTIGQDLGDMSHLPWVVTSYLLTSTAVTPLYGKLADIHGRRVTLLVAIGTFIAGSIACAVAPNMLVLILARAIQGLGGGGLISLAQTIVADVVAPRERGRYQGYIAGVFVASSVLGPALGGLLAEYLDWSMIFWINLPLGLVALLMTNSALRRLPRHERPHRLDVLGAVLMVVATVALLLALSWGGERYPWGSWQVLGLFAGSVLVWVLFALRLGSAEEPLLPLAVVLDPLVAAGTGTAGFAMGVFIALSVYLPIYLQTVLDLSVSGSGIAVIALSVGTVTGATVSGRLMLHIRHYRRLPLVGLAISALALLVLAASPDGLPLWLIEVILAVIGLGVGTVLPVTTVAVQNAVAMHQMGTATASVNFFRSLGGAIGVAAFGAILVGVSGGAGLSSLRTTAGPALDGATLDGIVVGFRWMFLASAIGMAAALASLLAMEERPLRGRNDPVAAPAPAGRAPT